MKKIICYILFIVILVSSVNITSFASDSENLIKNSGFENGKTNWVCSNDTFTVVDDARSGNCALNIKKSDERAWFSLHQFIENTLNTAGDGIYLASSYVKSTEDYIGKNIYLVMKFFDNNNTPSYAMSKVAKLSSDYQRIEVLFSYCHEEYKSVDFYFYTGVYEECEITVDDCSVILYADNSDLSVPNENIIRQSETQIGAIRWDAYYATSTSPTSCSVSDQVARTLSYYQNQAPYYSEKSDGQYDVKIKFTSAYAKYGTTYTIDDVSSSTLAPKTIKYNYGTPWETEADYAYNASIDYFAYLWYRTTDNMSLPRKAHVAKNGYISENKQLKMCGILEYGHFGKAKDISNMTDAQKLSAISVEHKELYQAMASSCYVKVNCTTGNMPILYLYDATNFTVTDELPKILEEAKFYTAYLAQINPEKYTAINDIYFVGMTSSSVSRHASDILRYYGFDALSHYALSYSISDDEKENSEKVQCEQITRYAYNDLSLTSGTENACYSIDYSSLANSNISNKTYYEKLAKYISSIPCATLGWSCVPRIKTAVSWTNDYGWQYVRPGTATEIAENVRNNLLWLQNNADSAKINHLLLYAWNEHDEGGYLCPTAKTDKNNNIIFNENGEAEADTSVLDAVAKVINEYKNSLNLKGDVNGDNKVNVLDRIVFSRYLAGWRNYTVISNSLGDINSDGKITALDRIILSRYLAGWSGNSIAKYFA